MREGQVDRMIRLEVATFRKQWKGDMMWVTVGAFGEDTKYLRKCAGQKAQWLGV